MDEKRTIDAKNYINGLEEEGKTDKEVIEHLSDMYTQKEISYLLDVNVRRVKYLYQKYRIKKNGKYENTLKCTGCGDEVHRSHFEIISENGKERYSQFCNPYCKNEYSRHRYAMRIFNEIERIKIESEIRIREQEIMVYKDYLKFIDNN